MGWWLLGGAAARRHHHQTNSAAAPGISSSDARRQQLRTSTWLQVHCNRTTATHSGYQCMHSTAPALRLTLILALSTWGWWISVANSEVVAHFW